MKNLQDILDKYEDFSSYLKEIDLQKLRQTHTRLEIRKFLERLNSIKIRSLSYEVGQMEEKMKVEEFPQLLGVHHFPILNEIDFLNEEKKIELDNFLVRFRVGNYLGNLWHIVREDNNIKRLEDWLVEKGVLERTYAIICSHCHEEAISPFMTAQEKEEIENAFKRYKELKDNSAYERVLEAIEEICMECEVKTDIRYIDELSFNTRLRMTMEKDSSLDNL